MAQVPSDYIHHGKLAGLFRGSANGNLLGAEGFVKRNWDNQGWGNPKVVYVTTAADDAHRPPDGSLRKVLEENTIRDAGPRELRPLIILFQEPMEIELKAPITIDRYKVYIDGRNSEMGHVTLKNHGLQIMGRYIVIRFIRIQPGVPSGTHLNMTSSEFEDLVVPSRMITLTLGARPFSWHVRF